MKFKKSRNAMNINRKGGPGTEGRGLDKSNSPLSVLSNYNKNQSIEKQFYINHASHPESSSHSPDIEIFVLNFQFNLKVYDVTTSNLSQSIWDKP